MLFVYLVDNNNARGLDIMMKSFHLYDKSKINKAVICKVIAYKNKYHFKSYICFS